MKSISSKLLMAKCLVTHFLIVTILLRSLGSPVVVIVLYIMVTQLGFDWAFTKAYADVHDNGDM